MRASFISLALLLLPAVALAEAETEETRTIAVTANRYPTDVEQIGRSIEVRLREELDDQEVRSLTDAVQNVSGVRMFDLGGPGAPGTTPTEIRGFRSGGTQILYGGMTLSDPSSVSGTFENFFSHLNLMDVESVEVLKGGAGVLYGSDAQGGAINLIPRMPEAGFKGEAVLEAGSFDTYSEQGLIQVGFERGGVLATASRVDSGGLDTHGNYGNTTASVLGTYEVFPERLTITPVFRFIDVNIDLNTSPMLDEVGNLVPDLDTDRNKSDVRAYFAGLKSDLRLTENITTKLKVYFNDIDREFFFDFSGFESASDFQGESLNLDSQTDFELASLRSVVSVGFEFEHQEFESDTGDLVDKAQRNQVGFFLYNKTSLFDELVDVSGGARVTHISDIDETNYTLEGAVSAKVPGDTGTRLHASIAEGFRAPTLFESKGTTIDFNTGIPVRVGNPDLDEEESLSWDVGVEQAFFEDRFVADLTFFQIDADETIIFDFANNTHLNGGGGKTQGIELSLLAKPTDWLLFRGAYTHLDRAEGLDGERRQRTPRDWFALTGVVKCERFTFSSELRYRDSQDIEFFGIEERFREVDVTVLDAAARYRLVDEVELFVRADNLFDVDYTEAGYNMPGASVYGGLRLKLG